MSTEPTINVFAALLQPMGERLRADARFADVRNIVYDVDEIAFAEMPAIEYAVDTPFEDLARGSGSFSLQTRALTARLIFTLWVYDAKTRQRMDEALFWLGGHLLDFLRDNTDFDPQGGVTLTGPLTWLVTRPEAAEGYVGVHRVVATYTLYSGVGK